MSRRLWMLSLAALAGGVGANVPLGAQEPPSHVAFCLNDDAARRFLDRVRYLIARADSSARPDQAAVEVEEPVCLAAAAAYADLPHRQATPHPPFAVMVVRADDRYYVQLAESPADRWEIALFDLGFRPLGTVTAP